MLQSYLQQLDISKAILSPSLQGKFEGIKSLYGPSEGTLSFAPIIIILHNAFSASGLLQGCIQSF